MRSAKRPQTKPPALALLVVQEIKRYLRVPKCLLLRQSSKAYLQIKAAKAYDIIIFCSSFPFLWKRKDFILTWKECVVLHKPRPHTTRKVPFKIRLFRRDGHKLSPAPMTSYFLKAPSDEMISCEVILPHKKKLLKFSITELLCKLILHLLLLEKK